MKLKDFENPLRAAGAIGLKAGTEAERQTPDEIVWMQTVSPSLDRMTVKTGGAEDCSTLKALIPYGFVSFVAPMIESPFAAEKFLSAAKWASGGRPDLLHLSLNIESISAFQKIEEILNTSAIKYIHKINVGKTDLGRSIGANAGDPRVLKMTAKIIEAARTRSLITGIGGTINARTITRELAETRPDEVETRHVIFSVAKMKDPVASIRVALEYEQAILKEDQRHLAVRLAEAEQRAKSLMQRLDSGKLDAA